MHKERVKFFLFNTDSITYLTKSEKGDVKTFISPFYLFSKGNQNDLGVKSGKHCAMTEDLASTVLNPLRLCGNPTHLSTKLTNRLYIFALRRNQTYNQPPD